MIKFRRSAPLLAVATVLGLGLSACSSSDSPGNSPATADVSGSAPTGVTLTMWHLTSDSQALLNLYKAYEAASGNTIKLIDIPGDAFETTIQSKWATGERPDLLEWHGGQTSVQQLNGANTMVDLSALPFVQKEGALAKVSGTLDGKTYALTLGFPQVFGVYYNKQIFKNAGLQPPQTYADLLSHCSVLKDKQPGVAPIFEAGGSGWPQQILAAINYVASANKDDAYAKTIVAKTAKLDDPNGPFVKGMTAYDGLRKANCFNKDAKTAKYEASLKAVLDGKAAMVAQHSDSIALLNADAGGDAKKVDDTLGFVGVSADAGVAAFAPSPMGTYYVPKNKDATKQRAALDFVNWASSTGYPAYVKDAKTLPAFPGTPDPAGLQGLTLEVKKAYGNAGLVLGTNIPGFGSAYGDLSAQLLAGQASPQQVADKMQKTFLQASAAAGN